MIRADIVKMYKDVHTWVGIVSGLALFIAFYAGAITMFEGPLKQWATPPPSLAAPVALSQTDELVSKTIAQYPEAGRGYAIHVETGADRPARMSWTVWPEGRSRGAPQETWFSALDEHGKVEVAQDTTSPVAQFVDVLHQQVGLPFDHDVSMLIMGVISLLYAVALISGVIIFLPGFAKDIFALRIGKNLKRMWLDVHNVLGIFSLPFHIIMALTAIVFAFHDQFYGLQDRIVYDGQLPAMFEANEPEHHVHVRPGEPFLSPEHLIDRLGEQVTGFNVKDIRYIFLPDGSVETMVNGEDKRYGHRGPDYGMAAVNAYTGDIMSAEYLPGHQPPMAATVTGFFALHFGNFGGTPIRWGYFVLGLAGAFLFYSGNLLWLESRRNKSRRSSPDAVQPVKARVLGALTVGVSLGCIAGLSLTIAAAKLLPSDSHTVGLWHSWIY
ncbi:PepSY-associated TM helix domain-containing protein, partial [Hyphomonas oceanitis]|uniref:PepSY-associated TM helix domain-containing protein n=1 Tax=Hyphomonas oceanitis TaxID=81033 RepID=UPI003000FC25